MNNIYFDNAATTQIDKKVFESMKKYFEDEYANPSSIYASARESKKAIDKSRTILAEAINANLHEIYFTSGGSESDNWAIKGIAESYKHKGNHIITSSIEHHAVLHVCKYLETKGFEVTYLPVNKNGLINIDDLKNAITPKTILISIMMANNEIGTILPISEIGKIAKNNNIILDTDAVQSFGHIPIDVNEMNIDLLSASAHKLYGPKGVGFLYIRKGIKITPLLHGGAQERNKRAGTENVASIVGFGTAALIALNEMIEETEHITILRNKLIDGILEKIPNCFLNGSRDQRLPGNVNISFEFIEGEGILLLLEMYNIYCSSGSACTSGSLDPSHVLLSIGLLHEEAHGSLRITLGKYNTNEEIDKLLEVLPSIIEKLRKMSPIYNK